MSILSGYLIYVINIANMLSKHSLFDFVGIIGLSVSMSIFTLFKALAVCNQSSLLEWDIALIVTGVLSLVVGIVIIITGTVIFFTRKSE